MRILIDISAKCGLPVSLSDDCKLVFSDDVEHMEAAARRTSDMAGLWCCNETVEDKDIYYMYRDVHLRGDGDLFKEHGLRYDMTVTKPCMIGTEFVKTAGHYHPDRENTDVGYPEVYEVVHGVAHYIIQKRDGNTSQVSDCVMIEAREGDKVIIPAGYGHVTVNPVNIPLVMSNLVCCDFNSEYVMYRDLKGAAYYEVVDRDDVCRFVPNRNYGTVVPLRRLNARCVEEFGVCEDVSLYRSFKDWPERFDWLVNPQRYVEEMELLMDDPACGYGLEICFGQKGSSSERDSMRDNNRAFGSRQD